MEHHADLSRAALSSCTPCGKSEVISAPGALLLGIGKTNLDRKLKEYACDPAGQPLRA
jgi:hypothetical protein